MEHNFLTEATKNYLDASVRAKSLTDQFYTDREFFKKTQEQKLREAKVIAFSFEQNFSGKKLAKQYAHIYEYNIFLKEKMENLNKKWKSNNANCVNLFFPEFVDIDYSEYSRESYFKDNLFVKDYKDGLLVVTQQIKDHKTTVLSFFDTNKNKQFNDSIFAIYDERFYNFENIDWSDEKFDNLILYIVAPNINKTKAVKIILKNNKCWNKKIKKYRLFYKKNKFLKTNDLELNFLRKKSYIINAINKLKSKEHSLDLIKDYQGNNRKNFLLKLGFDRILMSHYYSFRVEVNAYNNFQQSIFDEVLGFNEKIFNNENTFDELKQKYLKEIFPHEQNLGHHFVPGESVEMNKAFYKSKMIKSILLNNFCSFDTLPNGTKINLEHKSDADCFFFWSNISLFELFFNLFNEYNTKLSFGFKDVLNNASIGAEQFSDAVGLSKLSPIYSYFDITDEDDRDNYKIMRDISEKKLEFKNKHILQEAMDAQNGYLMPYDGAFELLDDPIYKFIRFREYEDFISIVISDKNERCLVEVFDKNKVDFKYMIWNDMKIQSESSEGIPYKCIEDIYTKLATCIRDAKILIERDSTMQFRGRRTPSGCNTKSTYEIYFPRSRYRRNPNKEQLRKEKDFFNESKKFSGTRRHHARKLVAGYKADKKQLLLAKQMDFYIPEGYTYVKASSWGVNMTKREVRYRNTSLNGLFYYTEKELSEAQKIDQMSSAGFEEYCSRYVEKLGYEIKHKSNYDGGIDIRAVKILDNMEAEDLLVQCKHWNSPIPPGAIRDFKTACDLEESNNIKKFMFITSSNFSAGAKQLAEKFNITLIDSSDLI